MAMRGPALLAVGYLAGILILAAPSAAAAPEAGPEVAVRVGLALPVGDVQSGSSLDTYASLAVPLVLEGGYRIDPSWFFGARFQYAFLDAKNPTGSCSGHNVSCSGSVVVLGLEGTYRFVPDRTFAPWLGLGFGYEWFSADYDAPNAGAGGTNKGYQGLAQAGGDIRVSRQMVLGPFVEAAFGRYDTADGYIRIGGTTSSGSRDISDTTWHGWIAFGVRGAFGF